MPQRFLVILPPLLLLVPLSCFLTFYYILPLSLSQNVLLLPPPSPLSSCENVSSPISPDDLSLWQMLRPLLATLEVAKVPYYLTDGSLLLLVRNCSLPKDDIDMSVDLSWWRKDGNAQFLEKTFLGAGLKRTSVFGSLDAFGYEEAWHEEKLNVKVDVFSTEVWGSGERRGAMWVGGTPFPCIARVEQLQSVLWWGQKVHLPFPLNPALASMYGPHFMEKQDWTWDVSPFETGYCRCQEWEDCQQK